MDLKEVLAIALRCFILFGFYDTWNGKNIAARIAPVPQESTRTATSTTSTLDIHKAVMYVIARV